MNKPQITGASQELIEQLKHEVRQWKLLASVNNDRATKLKAQIKKLEYLPDELSNDSPFNTGWNDCVRLIKQHRSKK
jgi:hypothetical protein